MHQRDRHRALADGRGDPLDRVGPHVAGGEDAGHAGLQVVRVARQRPARPGAGRSTSRSGPVSTKPRSSRATHAVEPVGARLGADEDEQPRRVDRRGSAPVRTSRRVSRSRWSSPSPPATSVYGCTSMLSIASICSIRYCDIDRRRSSPRIEQVHPAWRTGRSRPRPGRPSWRRRRCRRPGPRRRAPRSRPSRRRRPRPVRSAQPGRVELPVGHPGGQHHAVRGDRRAVGEAHHPGRARASPAPTTSRVLSSSAPNFSACRRARSVSCAPETPSGKPR